MNFIEAIGQIIYEKRFSLIALFFFALFFNYLIQPFLTWILRLIVTIGTDLFVRNIDFIDDKRFRNNKLHKKDFSVFRNLISEFFFGGIRYLAPSNNKSKQAHRLVDLYNAQVNQLLHQTPLFVILNWEYHNFKSSKVRNTKIDRFLYNHPLYGRPFDKIRDLMESQFKSRVLENLFFFFVVLKYKFKFFIFNWFLKLKCFWINQQIDFQNQLIKTYFDLKDKSNVFDNGNIKFPSGLRKLNLSECKSWFETAEKFFSEENPRKREDLLRTFFYEFNQNIIFFVPYWSLKSLFLSEIPEYNWQQYDVKKITSNSYERKKRRLVRFLSSYGFDYYLNPDYFKSSVRNKNFNCEEAIEYELKYVIINKHNFQIVLDGWEGYLERMRSPEEIDEYNIDYRYPIIHRPHDLIIGQDLNEVQDEDFLIQTDILIADLEEDIEANLHEMILENLKKWSEMFSKWSVISQNFQMNIRIHNFFEKRLKPILFIIFFLSAFILENLYADEIAQIILKICTDSLDLISLMKQNGLSLSWKLFRIVNPTFMI